MSRPEIHALAAALPDDLKLMDCESYAAVLDREGFEVARVGFDPWQVEVDLAVVFASGVDPDDGAPEAHSILEEQWANSWKARGFVPGEGEIEEAELLDDPEQSIFSYTVPVTTRAKGAAEIVVLLAWIREQTREWAM